MSQARRKTRVLHQDPQEHIVLSNEPMFVTGTGAKSFLSLNTDHESQAKMLICLAKWSMTKASSPPELIVMSQQKVLKCLVGDGKERVVVIDVVVLVVVRVMVVVLVVVAVAVAVAVAVDVLTAATVLTCITPLVTVTGSRVVELSEATALLELIPNPLVEELILKAPRVVELI